MLYFKIVYKDGTEEVKPFLTSESCAEWCRDEENVLYFEPV